MASTTRGKKLAYFLDRLDEEALDALGEYLRSPYGANSPQMVRLLSAGMEFRDGKGIDLERLHAHLFPDRAWDAKRAKYLQLRLGQLLDHLLDHQAFQAFRQDEQARYRYRLDAAIAQGWDSYIPMIFTQALRKLPGLPGANRLHQELQLETRYNSYLSDIAASGTDTHLDQLHGALDDFFLLQKVKYGAAAANMALRTGPAKPDPLLDLVLAYLDQSPEAHKLPMAYAHALRMIRGVVPDVEDKGLRHFQGLKKFFTSGPPCDKAELLDLYTYALNFCTVRIHQGQGRFISETKWLYEQVLAESILLESGRLSAIYYKNIVTIMVRFGEFDWAEDFVETYRERIASDPAGLTYLYNKAILAFHRGDYAGTIRMLYHRINEFVNLLIGLGARIYLCRALWKQGEIDWLRSNLASFRIYLKRQKEISDMDRRIYLLYVKYFEQILKAQTARPDRSRQKLERIRTRLGSSGEGKVFKSLQVILDELLGEV